MKYEIRSKLTELSHVLHDCNYGMDVSQLTASQSRTFHVDCESSKPNLCLTHIRNVIFPKCVWYASDTDKGPASKPIILMDKLISEDILNDSVSFTILFRIFRPTVIKDPTGLVITVPSSSWHAKREI